MGWDGDCIGLRCFTLSRGEMGRRWLLIRMTQQDQTSLRLAFRHDHEPLHGEAIGVQEQAIREVSAHPPPPRLPTHPYQSELSHPSSASKTSS